MLLLRFRMPAVARGGERIRIRIPSGCWPPSSSSSCSRASASWVRFIEFGTRAKRCLQYSRRRLLAKLPRTHLAEGSACGRLVRVKSALRRALARAENTARSSTGIRADGQWMLERPDRALRDARPGIAQLPFVRDKTEPPRTQTDRRTHQPVHDAPDVRRGTA